MREGAGGPRPRAQACKGMEVVETQVGIRFSGRGAGSLRRCATEEPGRLAATDDRGPLTSGGGMCTLSCREREATEGR